MERSLIDLLKFVGDRVNVKFTDGDLPVEILLIDRINGKNYAAILNLENDLFYVFEVILLHGKIVFWDIDDYLFKDYISDYFGMILNKGKIIKRGEIIDCRL